MRITLKQLEVFVAIAKKGAVFIAADSLFMTQAACSIALANLEAQLKGPLFDRHGKHLFLNERGNNLLVLAVNILTQVQELPIQANNAKQLNGTIAIGASTTIGNYLLPKMIGDFAIQYPTTKIQLNIANTEQIISQILSLEIDIGFIEGRCRHPKISITPWLRDELIIVAAVNHPLAKKNIVTLHDLYRAEWILREKGSGTREIFTEVYGNEIIPFLEFGNTEAIKTAVKNNIGISCLSDLAVKDLLLANQICILKLNAAAIKRDFYLLLHKNKFQTQLVKEFMLHAVER